jgi:hypothetical protein
MIPWDEKWPDLRYGDVFPLPLATETNWVNESWEVNVVLLLAADESGYSCKNVWTYREPYVDDRSTSPADAAAVTERAMSAFADRLQRLLQDD